MLLDAFLDVFLGFSNIEAVAVLSFTHSFVNGTGGLTRRCLATVRTYAVNFVFVWAVTWLTTQIGVCYTPQKFLFEIAKLFLL
jgi:hypothetical protein